MRILLSIWVIAAALAIARPARAQCASPTACICDVTGPQVLQVQAIDGGAVDGGATYQIVGVFGMPNAPNASNEIALPAGLPASLLVGSNRETVSLDDAGFTACEFGPSLSAAAAAQDILSGDACAAKVDPGFDGQCHDTGGGCDSDDADAGGVALAVLALLLGRRARRRG